MACCLFCCPNFSEFIQKVLKTVDDYAIIVLLQ